MKVFLIIKFSDASLSTKVLATLSHPIGILMMKSRFLSDCSTSGWSSSLNEMSTSDHLILLPGLIRWARMISRWSFFPLRLGIEGHAALKDHINLPHLLISVRIFLTLINSSRLLRHRRCLGWHLLPIQKSFALFQIVPYGTVNLTPLLRVIGMLKMPLLFLLRGLFTTESMVSSVPTIAWSTTLTSWSSFFCEVPLPHDSRSHAQASEASIHISATASRSATVFGFFMAISSTVLMLLTSSQKALMISMS
jgi:hypothetical protein